MYKTWQERPSHAGTQVRRSYCERVSASRNRTPPALIAASVTVGDLGVGAVLGASVAALSDAARAVVIEGIRLADDAGGGARDLLLAARAPAEVPDGVVAIVCRGAEHGVTVPVITVPDSAAWTTVLDEVVDVLGARPGRGAAARARAAFRVALVEGGGWERLAEIGSGLLQAPVAIVDDHLDVVACAAEGGFTGPFAREAVEGVSDIAALIDAGPDGTRVGVPGPDGRPVVVIVTGEGGVGARDARVVREEMVEACALEWSRHELLVATESRLRGDLIRELMAGESPSRESLVRRARHLGADLSSGAVAVLGAIGDPAVRESPDTYMVRRLVRHARSVVDMHWPQALLDWDDGRLLVLLPGPRDPDTPRSETEARAHALATRLISSAGGALPGLTLAISRFTPDPERLGAALEEAGLALSIGARLGRAGDVITFEETGTYKLLFQIFAERPDELADFYEQTLAPLVRYDEQYQTELVGTLATYLELDGNLAATASTLYTHRHTVRYRLDRITELSGLDVGRTDDREKLTLGLKAMRLLGRKVPVPMAKESSNRPRTT